MSAAGFTPIQLYRSTTASAVPTSGNLADGELAINTNDGKLYYKDSGGAVQLIASKAGASGDVVGPASATDNAVVRFDGTTGKLVQNSVVTIADSTGDIAGAGSITSTSASGILTRAAATQDGVELIGRAGGSSSYKVTLTPTTLGGNRTLTLPDTTGTVALTGSTVASFSAGSTGFTPNTATTGAVTLAGTLATTNGGTGLTSFTANGVVYASSSSALTTGSALTFDGTNLLQVSSGAGKLRLGINTSDQFLDIYRDSGSGASVYNAAQGSNFGFHVWQVTNSEQMRLTSTGLGIGTSSPAVKLHVLGGGSGAAQIRVASTVTQANVAFYDAYDSGGYTRNWVLVTNKNAYGDFVFMRSSTQGGDPLSGTTTMTLDSSGNLGLGVTPSAWYAPSKVLQIVGGTTIEGRDNYASIGFFSTNVYRDSSAVDRYIASIAAAQYVQDTGVHKWYTAPSGTAGNAITFSQVMTLDASGRLGIAVTSPTYRVDVDTTNNSGNIWRGTRGTSQIGAYQSLDSTGFFGMLSNHALAFVTDSTERARITSGGEVYIAGTTDQGAYNLQCNGTGVWGAGAYVNGSDERLKDDIQSLDSCLNVVNALRPVTFKYKPEHSKDQSVQTGFIAQELKQVLAGKPYLEGLVQEGPQHLNVAYQNIIPLLTKAMQEQQALIESLTSRVAQLEGA
jgi:hypothetical protein